MMNCLQARQKLLANPMDGEIALQQHLATCEVCHRYAQALQQQDAKIKQALTDVPVPHALAERILLRKTLQHSHRIRLAWAASVVWVVLMAGVLWYQLSTPLWSEVVLAHVLKEPYALNQHGNYPESQFIHAMAEYGVAVKQPLGQIHYLDHCQMPNGRGLHVVVETEKFGRVSLIVSSPVSRLKTEKSYQDGFTADLLPLPQAVIGVVTDQPNQLSAMRAWLLTRLSST